MRVVYQCPGKSGTIEVYSLTIISRESFTGTKVMRHKVMAPMVVFTRAEYPPR